MMKLTVLHPPSMSGKLEISLEVSSYCVEDRVYVLPHGVTLVSLFQEYKDRIEDLETRYAYLEKARNWIVKNIRSKK